MLLSCVKPEWIGKAQRTCPFVVAWVVAFVPDRFGKKSSGKCSLEEINVLCRIQMLFGSCYLLSATKSDGL